MKQTNGIGGLPIPGFPGEKKFWNKACLDCNKLVSKGEDGIIPFNIHR